MNESRREFLKSSGCALSMVALATQMHHLGAMSALAQKVRDRHKREDLLAPSSDYKALVCLYFAGGNDGNNMVIPIHDDTTISNYTAYNNARNTQGLALARSNDGTGRPIVLPITVPRLGGLAYGMHPNLGPLTQNGTTIINDGIHGLWGQGKLAIVTNVGNLVRPLTKAQFLNPAFQKPYQLYSHSDQIAQSQTSISNTQSITGWGGRISDRMTEGNNPAGIIPMITSISGAQLFTAGQSTVAMAIGGAENDTDPATNNLRTVLTPAGFAPPLTGSNLDRYNAFQALRTQDRSSNYVAAASGITDLAMQANNALQNSQDVGQFPATSIGLQLKQVARVIKSRSSLGVNRQIFFVQIGGFDTHTNQPATHISLFTQLSQAMRAFYDEMVVQTLQNNVTLFTLSDFNRTLNPAGSGTGVGSDHAWGNHMLVMGGAVAGGNFYGSLRPDGTGNYFPTLVMGTNGPDDADNYSGGRGRWIPTTSVEQYAVRMAQWFGLAPGDEAAVFPNLVNFPGTFSQLNFLP